MDNVLISANYHACGPQCSAVDANCTEGRLNGMPQSGTLIVAAYGVTIEANSLYQFALGGEIPSQHPGPEGPSGCRVPNPLVVAGTHSGFYARDVRLSTATGWDSEQGYAYLYGDPAKAEERLFLETFGAKILHNASEESEWYRPTWNSSGQPWKMAPGCLTSTRPGLPCCGYGSTPSAPPKCSTMPCSPRHTPKMGSRLLVAISMVADTLKSDGRPGPGESTTSDGWRRPSSASSKPKRSVVTIAPVWRR